ncbi:MAG: PIN domain-containing protein [Bacilli bacterium]|nr:PIN domain-containing protein [Bacilli bacterium]
MRLLVDTNVFLDFILQRDSGCRHALEFFLWCRKYKNSIYVTSMSLRDIEYAAMRSVHDKKKANRIVADVYSLCNKVIGISADSAINAIYEDYKDFEDELIIQAAKEELLDAVVTSNIKDFENRGIPVFTPQSIVNQSSY